MRALGLDLGSKRIGVALSDSAGVMALPYEVLQRTGDRERDHRRIAALVAETEAEIVVVGLPLSMNGSEGPQAARVRAAGERLARFLRLPIEYHDERLSSAEHLLARLDGGSVGGPPLHREPAERGEEPRPER